MTGDYQTEKRMGQKMAAIPFPDFTGKSVLDVGCDHGFWSFTAARSGAAKVVGLDRNREVRGKGLTNLVAQNEAIARHDHTLGTCTFQKINLGKEWKSFGRFDVVLVMSVYHHIFEQCGDHGAVWFWLWKHCAQELLFEGPVDDTDPVVKANVTQHRAEFTHDKIFAAAGVYFDVEYIGPALHEPTRFVYRLKPKDHIRKTTEAVMLAGAGGATPAFHYAKDRRIGEIKSILGFRPVPGSLNLRLDGPFDWDAGYYRSQILDVVDRSKGLESEWAPRWMRFYPLTIDGVEAVAIRFEGERYDQKFMEVVAPVMLREKLTGPRVVITR